MVDASTPFKLAYQVSPITLTGGLALSMPGGAFPILALTNALAFGSGLLDGADIPDLDQAWAAWEPIAGSTLIAQKIGLYPFANQYVAANAVIFDPLTVSMRMICPARQPGDLINRQMLISAMQASLSAHNQAGGLYTVATPAFVWDNCVMLDWTDTAAHDTKQVQDAFQLNFMQPLVTLSQATGAQNSLMQSISNGTPTSGATSGLGQTVGAGSSGTTGTIIPGGSSTVGGLSTGPTGFVIGSN